MPLPRELSALDLSGLVVRLHRPRGDGHASKQDTYATRLAVSRVQSVPGVQVSVRSREKLILVDRLPNINPKTSP